MSVSDTPFPLPTVVPISELKISPARLAFVADVGLVPSVYVYCSTVVAVDEPRSVVPPTLSRLEMIEPLSFRLVGATGVGRPAVVGAQYAQSVVPLLRFAWLVVLRRVTLSSERTAADAQLDIAPIINAPKPRQNNRRAGSTTLFMGFSRLLRHGLYFGTCGALDGRGTRGRNFIRIA